LDTDASLALLFFVKFQ
jgi:hypothetical protein